MKVALGISAFCVLTACSDASNVASSSAPLDQVTLGDSVKARGCTFTIGTGVEAQTFPPIYVAFVRVTGNQHQCPHDDITLGTSYALPSVAIAQGHGDVVADWTSKSTSRRVGSGDHYVATYARFFDSASTAPSVVAY